MRFRWVKVIYFKELLETFRDHRTLFMMIGLPILLYPIILIVASMFFESHFEELTQRTLEVAIYGQHPDDLIPFITEDEDYSIDIHHLPEPESAQDFCTSAKEAILEKKAAVVLLINQDFTCKKTKVEDDAPLGRFELLFDYTNDFSLKGKEDLAFLLKQYSKKALQEHLLEAGLDIKLATPYKIRTTNIADEKRMSGKIIGDILPFLIILMAIMGAFLPAIDLSAGEKERGTLETLISAPIKTAEIVAGKYLTIVSISLITSAVNIASLGLTLNFLVSKAFESNNNPAMTWGNAVIVFLILLPTSMFLSAVLMAIASLARNFKEGQNLLTPVQIAFLVPISIAYIPEIELSWVTAFVPIGNIALVMKQVFTGSVEAENIFIVMLANTAYTIMALYVAAQFFKSESVLFGISNPWKRFRLKGMFKNLSRPAEPKSTPAPGVSVLFFAVILVILFYAGNLAQAMDVVSGLLITEWVILLIPALLIPLLLRIDIKETFSLRLPSLSGFIGSLLLAGSVWVVAVIGLFLMELILPMPEAYAEILQDFFNLAVGQLSTPGILLLFALSPAICEEAVFRGIILSGLKDHLPKWQTIVLIGLMFGVFHLSIYRIVPTGLIGMVITFAVLQTRSILPAVVIHFGSNALIFSSMTNPVVGQLMGLSNGQISNWTNIGVFSIVFVAGIFILLFTKPYKQKR